MLASADVLALGLVLGSRQAWIGAHTTDFTGAEAGLRTLPMILDRERVAFQPRGSGFVRGEGAFAMRRAEFSAAWSMFLAARGAFGPAWADYSVVADELAGARMDFEFSETDFDSLRIRLHPMSFVLHRMQSTPHR